MKPKSYEEELIVCKNCRAQLDKLTQDKLFTRKDMTFLNNPARVINVNFPVVMENGEAQLISGFRVQYNDALGPTKGGLRMHQESDIEEVSELAFLMSLKTSLLGLPYGGAKGAIKINPKNLSLKEKERVVRGFTRAISKFIGSEYDIPAPDVNTGPQEMSWILDEYEKIVGYSDPAIVTGKAIDEGGSLGRDTSTARGGLYTLLAHLNTIKNSKSPTETTVAIQGFGNVGGHIAELLNIEGFKIVAVSDSGTGLYDPDGLDIKKLSKFKKGRGKFDDREEDKISNKNLLLLPVDILIPAALGGVIGDKNVSKIKAKIIVEMANAPISPEADSVLEGKGVTVIPDILSNAGGVVVSYFEWKQNKSNEKWSLEDINNKLKKYMLEAYKKVTKEAKKDKICLRSAGFNVAIKRILDAEKKRMKS
jgi:glutamate dehydrogenase